MDRSDLKKHGRFRKMIQAGFGILSNSYLKGFAEGTIYKGPLKNFCVPGMNCYAERMVNRFRSECLQYLSFSDEHNLHVVLENFVWYYNNQRPNRKHGGRCIVDDESYGQTEGEIERVDLIPGIVIYFRRVPRKRAA